MTPERESLEQELAENIRCLWMNDMGYFEQDMADVPVTSLEVEMEEYLAMQRIKRMNKEKL